MEKSSGNRYYQNANLLQPSSNSSTGELSQEGIELNVESAAFNSYSYIASNSINSLSSAVYLPSSAIAKESSLSNSTYGYITQRSSEMLNTSMSSGIKEWLYSNNNTVTSSSSMMVKNSEPEVGTPFGLVAMKLNNELNGLVDYIFTEDTVRVYDIIIDTLSLERLNSAPKNEEYETAHLVFEGDTISNIQMRYKGSLGAWKGCTEGDPRSKVGAKTCLKLPIKLKFNTAEDPKRMFYGLKKLQFHHMGHYNDQMKERLVYWLHREVGNPAPRAVHVLVKINGQLQGLYTLVEQIDSQFTRIRWEHNEGNIYKNIVPYQNFITDVNMLNSALKTNEEPPIDHFVWSQLENELDAVESQDTIVNVITKWTDPKTLVSTVLLSMILDHWDSPFVKGANNAYWYADPIVKKMYPIPWDMDDVRFTNKYEGVISNAIKCNSSRSDKLTKHWLCFEDETLRALHLIKNGLDKAQLQLEIWENQVSPIHQKLANELPGEYPESGALTYSEWQQALSGLKRSVTENGEMVSRIFDDYLLR